MFPVQEARFDAVADRRLLLPLFCTCPPPASMRAPACQLFELLARKIRYDPSRAILERAPLNLLIALIPHRFEMISKLTEFLLSTVPLVPRLRFICKIGNVSPYTPDNVSFSQNIVSRGKIPKHV